MTEIAGILQLWSRNKFLGEDCKFELARYSFTLTAPEKSHRSRNSKIWHPIFNIYSCVGSLYAGSVYCFDVDFVHEPHYPDAARLQKSVNCGAHDDHCKDHPETPNPKLCSDPAACRMPLTCRSVSTAARMRTRLGVRLHELAADTLGIEVPSAGKASSMSCITASQDSISCESTPGGNLSARCGRQIDAESTSCACFG